MTTGRRAGIDVGGTKCHGVVIDAAGVVVHDYRLPTPAGHDAIVDTLVEVASQLAPFDSIGLGVPGLVTRDGVIKASPNLVDVRDFPVGRLLSQRLGTVVHVDNDATCATVAEWRAGAARGFDDVVMVTLGTGIGGGVVANGQLVRGANGEKLSKQNGATALRLDDDPAVRAALNDAAVRGFTTELDDVSTVLADNRTNLTGALTDLGQVLAVTEKYFRKHRRQIRTTTADVNLLAAALADRSNELAGVLHVAPHAIVDLSNTIQDQAITGRATLSALDNVPQLLCGAVLGVGGTAEQCSTVLQPLIDLLGIGSIGGTR